MWMLILIVFIHSIASDTGSQIIGDYLYNKTSPIHEDVILNMFAYKVYSRRFLGFYSKLIVVIETKEGIIKLVRRNLFGHIRDSISYPLVNEKDEVVI